MCINCEMALLRFYQFDFLVDEFILNDFLRSFLDVSNGRSAQLEIYPIHEYSENNPLGNKSRKERVQHPSTSPWDAFLSTRIYDFLTFRENFICFIFELFSCTVFSSVPFSDGFFMRRFLFDPFCLN